MLGGLKIIFSKLNNDADICMIGQKLKTLPDLFQKLVGKENGRKTCFYLRSYVCPSLALDCLVNPGSPAPDTGGAPQIAGRRCRPVS